MTGCDRCDWQGPTFDTFEDAADALHREWHNTYRPLEEWIGALLDRVVQ